MKIITILLVILALTSLVVADCDCTDSRSGDVQVSKNTGPVYTADIQSIADRNAELNKETEIVRINEKREVMLLGIFKIDMPVEIKKVNGEIAYENKPWWHIFVVE